MNPSDLKLQYLEEQYENITPLGNNSQSDHCIFLAINRETQKIVVKKYVSANVIPIYEKLKSISNAHLTKIYDCSASHQTGIVIEEFINGMTLREYLNIKKTLSEEEMLKIVNELCDVLKVIHTKNIIHRDINPENILISNDGVLKLIDFGIAREPDKDKRQDTTILGTVGYAAPEQFGFTQTDTRTDIYAVGVLLNELLTGKLPGEMLYDKAPYKKIIKKCIEIDARIRYQNVDELSKELKSTLPNAGTSFWLPGFRTATPWKSVVASIGYFLMIIYTIGSMTAYASSVKTLILSGISLLLYLWLNTLIAVNIGNWDRKLIPFRNLPKPVTILMRVLIWFILFYCGILLENHVRYDLLGFPRTTK